MFEGYEELNTQDVEWMQEVIRTLLAQTFLPERKYDKKYGRMMPDRMYDFCDRHLEFLTEYFAVAGIKLCQDTELGIIYLEGTDGIGEKLPKLATIYLLLLKLIYDEKMAAVSSSVNVITTFGELNRKAGEFRLIKGPSSMTEIKRAFAILKKYQMVEFLDVFDEQLENTRIMIYPCINLVLMREDVNGLLGSFSDEVKDNEVDGQENLEWSSEETLSENDMTDEESDIEPEEMNVDEEGETEDGTDESGI